jgi:predicted permease
MIFGRARFGSLAAFKVRLAMLQDLRFALRNLRQQSSFTIVALLALALGIGANTAIFSVIRGVLLRPLPYEQPDRIASLWEQMPKGWTGTASVPNLDDWRAQNKSFESLVGWGASSMNLQQAGNPERLRAVTAYGDLFGLLRAKAALGRTLTPEDDGRDTIVISHGLWKRRFGGSAEVLNQTVRLDNKPYTIVGVMPEGFDFPPGGIPRDVWTTMPLTPERKANRGDHFLRVVARLRPGTTIEQAQAEMKQIADGLSKAYPNQQADRGVLVKLLSDDVTGYVKPALQVLIGAVGLVLLIACANVANLLLARAAGRRRELAVRVALGASRARLVRLMLTESVLLAIAGGLLGGVLALWGSEALVTLAEGQIPRTREIRFDAMVFAFLLACSTATGILFGWLPAWRASNTDPQEGLKEGGRGSVGGSRDRLRQVLVVGELALAFVLLVGAGLLIKTFLSLLSTQSGMNTERVLTLRMAIPKPSIEKKFIERLIPKVQAIPGVKHAGIISHLPLVEYGINAPGWVDGKPQPREADMPTVEVRAVTPDVFAALGVPLLKGRLVDPDEPASEKRISVLVNKTLVDALFPGEEPIGRFIKVGGGAPLEIVGVVGDVRQRGLDRPPAPEVYYQTTVADNLLASSPTLVVSAELPAESLTNAVRQAVQETDPDQPIFGVKTLERVVADSISDRKLYLVLLGLFAALALALAMAGIYGVLSYLAKLRTREFGVRMALGARQADLLGMVLRQGMVLVGAGMIVGLIASFGLTRLLETLLYGVKPSDPLTYIAVAVTIAFVALIACFVPAWRATQIDPVIALRDE